MGTVYIFFVMNGGFQISLIFFLIAWYLDMRHNFIDLHNFDDNLYRYSHFWDLYYYVFYLFENNFQYNISISYFNCDASSSYLDNFHYNIDIHHFNDMNCDTCCYLTLYNSNQGDFA